MKFKNLYSVKIFFYSLAFLILITGVVFSYNMNNITNNKTNNKTKPDILDISGLVARVSTEDMAAKSSLIVEGTVSSITSSTWNTSDGLEPNNITLNDSIYHNVLVNVNKIIKGSVEDTNKPINIRVYNGEIPNGKTIKKLISDGYPEYTVNEKVILFLSYDDSPFNKLKATDYYVTTGMFQGKFNITGKEASNRKDKIDRDKLVELIEKNKNNPIQPSQKNDW